MDAAVHLVLRDADPNGIVTATRDNWTGKAFSLPIADLGLMKELLRSAGVYVLLGVLDDGTDTPVAYVGEAEEVVGRLTTRHSQLAKDDITWQRVVVFVSQAEDLHKAHIKWLEANLVERAGEAGRVTLTNGNTPPRPNLPQFDQVFAEAFLANMLVLYPLLGVNAFTPGASSKRVPATPDTHALAIPTDELFLKRAGAIIAKGRCTASGGITLLSGSLIAKQEASHAGPVIRRIRRLFADNGWLVDHDDDWWELTNDYDCTASSTAASVVVGRAMRGPHAWKNSAGAKLADLLDAAAARL